MSSSVSDRPAGIRASDAYLPDLESLRGWALMLVFVYHADSVVMGTARAPRILRIAGALLAMMFLSCQAQDDRQPNIVVILIDTLRADHVGSYGYSRPTTPNIDAMAGRGIVFSRAQSTSSWTKPSVASLFTSRWPGEHRATSFRSHLRSDLPTLPALLQEAGYFTAAHSGNFVHVNSDSGLLRGFHESSAPAKELRPEEGKGFWSFEGPDGATIQLRPYSASEINESALAMLEHADGRPFFLYVHYMEPHSSYSPPDRLRERFARQPTTSRDAHVMSSDAIVAMAQGVGVSPEVHERAIDLYDAEIAAADEGVAQLVSALRARGLADPTIFVVLSDHGEEFADHGRYFHGITLHAESISIPLIFYDSRNPTTGLRIDEPVSIVDVAPTLLAAASAEIPADMQGQRLPLRPEEAEKGASPRELVAELHPDPIFEDHAIPRSHRASILRWPWKWISRRGQDEIFYSLDSDPTEQEPVSPSSARIAEDLRSRVTEWQQRLDSASEAPPSSNRDEALSPERRARLRALGYAD